MKAWTLDQLKFAEEVCFPDTFEKLWAKHSKGDVLATPAEEALYLRLTWKRSSLGLVAWFMSFGRKYMAEGSGEVFDAVLTDLIGDYGK